jgi:hypothetical protein
MAAVSRRTSTDAIRIEGLADFQRAVRAAGPRFARELRNANRDAAETVADTARARARSLGGMQARAATTIKARGEQRYAKLTLGDARHPEALGANFGAYHDRIRNTRRGIQAGWNQFPEWGGNQFTGGARDQFLYWAVRRSRQTGEFAAAYEQALDRLIRLLSDNQGTP